ncbi:MAG: TRAM domain-containing protein [Deltaproteobacteria bacterium]|nr:TRAM domain-containing protein [Deltaproteobacteria bacterium]
MLLIRAFFTLAAALLSFQIAKAQFNRVDYACVAFFISGALVIYLFYLISRLKKIPLRTLLGGFTGMVVGLFIANLLLRGAPFVDLFDNPRTNFTLYLLVYSLLAYVALEVGLKKGDEFDLIRALITKKRAEQEKIVDTSVIIDGRIADVCETGFIEGTLIIPQFVLHELQLISDSADSLKRVRGRRGLDILKRIQNQAKVQIIITDEDFPRIKEVDAKLVALAKKRDAQILTNDFNLNKVADIQGVGVLNLNQLAEAMKPLVLPGETLDVMVSKEGKEAMQGVAYLDDGTMVVIDQGLSLLGEAAKVTVTSVLQTTAGRMIFARRQNGA